MEGEGLGGRDGRGRGMVSWKDGAKEGWVGEGRSKGGVCVAGLTWKNAKRFRLEAFFCMRCSDLLGWSSQCHSKFIENPSAGGQKGFGSKVQGYPVHTAKRN